LELDDITMQFRRNNLLGTPVGITNVELVFGSGVPSGNKSDAARHGSAGLWLPSSFSLLSSLIGNTFHNMVPRFWDGYDAVSHSPVSGDFLFNHAFPEASTPQGDIEFFFRLEGTVMGGGAAIPENLLVARLEVIPGTDPATLTGTPWYRRVRPFSFGIHGITRQRGGVTVLNNVINSNNRERVFVDFRMLRSGRVTAQVFTLDGTLVRVLQQGNMPASGDRFHRIYWDGTNRGGRPVARGMYFIRIVAPDIDEIRKVMVVR
ncbi:MAG: hypothetical protein FWC65_05025, partial [Treponema sp.]|nr:hypothetical protein [Treponema sp.]